MIEEARIEKLARLADTIVEALALADELKLLDVGISLDSARLDAAKEVAAVACDAKLAGQYGGVV